MSTSTTLGLPPRRAALHLVAAVQGGALLSESLGPLKDLPPEDRARAQRLAEATLRWADRADRMLGPHLRLKPYEEVLNVLRLGVVEICVDGAAPHGVVHALVEAAKSDKATVRGAGLINAVLRKITREAEKWDELPLPRLPKALRKRLVTAYDKHIVAEVEAAHARGAPLDMTLRVPEALDLSIWDRMKPELLPTGSLRLHGAGQVSALPGYDEGDWWVQDAAAALPAQILNAQPGERVLDLCAAPGGKTMQLAAAGATVTALDRSEERMARTSENLARTKLTAEVVIADALEYEASPFDAVLLDAPCSATGTIRRHPDLPVAKAGVDFSELFALQSALIDRAVALTKPGGRLVYCTCSLLPEEGETQIEAALARHTNLSVAPLQPEGIDPSAVSGLGLRLRPDFWPDRGGMDGFFITLLAKSG